MPQINHKETTTTDLLYIVITRKCAVAQLQYPPHVTVGYHYIVDCMVYVHPYLCRRYDIFSGER